MTELAHLVRTGRIIITAGSGAVGKTTTAAVLAMEAARAARRAVVVTIDPAKRLADALGLSDGLSNEPVLGCGLRCPRRIWPRYKYGLLQLPEWQSRTDKSSSAKPRNFGWFLSVGVRAMWI